MSLDSGCLPCLRRLRHRHSMFSSGSWSFPAKPSRLMMPLAILAHCGFPLVPWSGEIIVGCSQSSRIVVRMQLRKDADLLTETWFPGTGPWTTDPGPPCADRRPKNNARLRALFLSQGCIYEGNNAPWLRRCALRLYLR